VVNLAGHDGEPPEFSAVKWLPLDGLVSTVWEGKRPAYARFRDWAAPLIAAHAAGAPLAPHPAALVDLGGLWRRNGGRSVGLTSYLAAHGHSPAAADALAAAEYVQRWDRWSAQAAPAALPAADAADPSEALVWRVRTYDSLPTAGAGVGAAGAAWGAGGARPRRDLAYALGPWEEAHGAGSALFGSAGAGTVRRWTTWVRAALAEGGWAHKTTTVGPVGRETTTRFRLHRAALPPPSVAGAASKAAAGQPPPATFPAPVAALSASSDEPPTPPTPIMVCLRTFRPTGSEDEVSCREDFELLSI
jgi:hypothetical protein